jgi:hypothetical protein
MGTRSSFGPWVNTVLATRLPRGCNTRLLMRTCGSDVARRLRLVVPQSPARRRCGFSPCAPFLQRTPDGRNYTSAQPYRARRDNTCCNTSRRFSPCSCTPDARTCALLACVPPSLHRRARHREAKGLPGEFMRRRIRSLPAMSRVLTNRTAVKFAGRGLASERQFMRVHEYAARSEL